VTTGWVVGLDGRVDVVRSFQVLAVVGGFGWAVAGVVRCSTNDGHSAGGYNSPQ